MVKKISYNKKDPMKHTYILMSILIFYSIIIASNDHNAYSISIEPQWRNLDTQTTEFGSSLFLAGSFIFSNTSGQHINLDKLSLHWQGQKLNSLMGSLYKKRFDRDFLPIEDYWICDSSWSTTNQTLILEFDKSQLLGPKNIFYFVLTIPPHLENAIKQGSFEIVGHTLPQQFQTIVSKKPLSLSFKVPNGCNTIIS